MAEIAPRLRRGQSEVAGVCAAGWLDRWTPPIDSSVMRAASGLDQGFAAGYRGVNVCTLICLFWSVFFICMYYAAVFRTHRRGVYHLILKIVTENN